MQVGNGIMNTDTDTIGQITYPWTHGLISDQTYEDLIGNCTKSNVNPKLCKDLEDKMSEEMGNIDPYSIYAPICLTDSSKWTKVCIFQPHNILIKGIRKSLEGNFFWGRGFGLSLSKFFKIPKFGIQQSKLCDVLAELEQEIKKECLFT